jgi:putative ABC transport system permease protein
MTTTHLIFREIAYRKGSFLLGVASVAAAVACAVGAILSLRTHDAQTERIIAAKEAETRARMAVLQDDYRKITKGLGFNVLILPKAQDLNELFAEDRGSTSMPEAYVDRLARSGVATIQHLLPTLQQKLRWPETERTIILSGVHGEVPIARASLKDPIQGAVPAGTMVVGWELHRTLRLEVGQKVKLLGRAFTVGKLQPERGTKDDITIWISLGEAQQLLGQPGRISGILALECVCAADSLDKVRGEITRLLPDTQVLEFQSQTLARAEARQRAAVEAAAAIEREQAGRARLRRQREALASILVPTVVLGSTLWIAFLTLGNVRERRPEIGLLRALGLPGRKVVGLFLGRAVVIGLAGAVLGYGGGVLVGTRWFQRPTGPARWDPWLLLAAVVLAPLFAVVAGWIPSLLAAQQDPAEVLSEE